MYDTIHAVSSTLNTFVVMTVFM